MERQGRIIFSVMVGAFLLNGCMVDTWESYAAPEYGRERANRICHPYSQCTQGVWVTDESGQEEANVAYARCTEEKLQRENGWSKDTVSLGLEINRCMVAKGYRLVPE